MTRTHDHTLDEVRERAALYALGALCGEDARDFEAHLNACSRCAAEAGAFSTVAAELGRAAQPRTPRPDLRTRVLERLASESPPAEQPVHEKSGLRFVHSSLLEWEPGSTPGLEVKTLSVDPHGGFVTRLVRMPPGSMLRPHRHADVEESYVLEGDLVVSGVSMRAGDYCRAEPGSVHGGVMTRGGCVFLAICSQYNEPLA